jgi:hypothetical protein
MATIQKGGHFYALIKDDGITYKADNMNERLQLISGDTLYGKAKNTIYVVVGRRNTESKFGRFIVIKKREGNIEVMENPPFLSNTAET